MPPWSLDEAPDLHGKVALVTGANSGLGLETARGLALRGARVLLACRDEGRGKEALDRLTEAAPGADLELRRLDLADLGSVRELAKGVAADPGALDLIVNNAGVMAIPRRETADGFEMQFGTNHLGHFALTGLLLDTLLARAAPRVVTVSSLAALVGRIDFDDLSGRRRYNKWLRYAQSKLANQLFALELDRRARARGLPLVSVAAHPGYSATNLQAASARSSGSTFMERVMDLGNALFAQGPAEGALPSLYAATDPGVTGGEYFGPHLLFGMRGHPVSATWVRAARGEEAARRLWSVSEELTGVSYLD